MSIPSQRESVVIQGRLRGMGYAVPCMLVAVKVTLPSLDMFEYVKCEVVNAPAHLPDGQYEVSFEGRAMEVQKLDGRWLAGEV